MTTYIRTQEIEHPIGPAGRFGLRVTSSDTEITGSDGPVARVRITHEIRAGSESEADELLEDAGFEVRQADGSLEVSEPEHGNGLNALAHLLRGGRSTVGRVEAWVPRGATVEYTGVSADLTASDLTGTQRYRTVSGDVVLDRVGGDVRVNGVSADVSIRADGGLSLDAHSVSGDLSGVAAAFESVRASTVSGDVELEGSLYPRVSHRVETVSGDLAIGVSGGLTLEVRGLSTDVDLDIPHRAEGSRERRRYVVGDGSAHLTFSSMSGDVSIRAARQQSGVSAIPSPPPPVRPLHPAPPTAAVGEEQLAVLKALERGEIDVDEAARRLGGQATDG